MMAGDAPFLAQLVAGVVEASDIHDFIDDWHEEASQSDELADSFQLYDYLGMTVEEYKRWIEEPIKTDKSPEQVLNEIAEERRQEENIND